MKQRAAVALLSVVTLILLTTSTTAGAAVNRLGGTITALGAPSRGSAVAFGNNVYLVVSSWGTVRGQLLTAEGTPAGAMFVIQASTIYTHFPRVAFSPHANGGQGAFLVTWHESDLAGGATSVHARLVSLSGAFISADTIIGTDGSWWEAGAAIAYATVSREFLVVWQRRVGSLSDISAARVSNSGALLGNIVVSSNEAWERDPSVAYNPVTDEFLVAYAGASTVAFVNAQRVKAGTGTLPSGPITLAFGLSTWITDVAYSSSTNQFLVAWYQDPPKAVYGRVVAADGSLPGIITPLSIRFRTYDGLALRHSDRAGGFLLISNDSQLGSYEVGGVSITLAGQPEDSSGVVLTAAGDAPNYYPMLAASTAQPEWMLVASHNFAFALGQRVGTAASGPPPPPPCAVEPLPSVPSMSLSGAAQSQNISVTASTADCAWTATSSASWITITAGGSGAGPGTTTFAVTRNASGAARTGTVSIGSGAVTIQQAPAFGNAAAVHDINGDGTSDLMWHNINTGHVAVWNLVGHTVTATYDLTPAGVNANWKVAGSGDLNGDGYADIVWRHAGGTVACWLLQGGQIASTQYLTINGATATELDTMWEIRAVGDLNGDGKSDIIWQNMGVGTLRGWFMDGSVVRSTSSFNLGMPDWSWKIAGAGDLNGDGMADLVWQNDLTGDLGAWLMSSHLVVGQSRLSIPAVSNLNWKVRGVGDTNRDGFADLLWQNMSTGEVGVWYLNGFNVIGTYKLLMGVGSGSTWQLVGPG